jgi:peptide chain release factor 3
MRRSSPAETARVHRWGSRAYDAVDAPTVLVEYAPELRAIEANWPKIKFHALREHAGLVFQRQLEG